MLTILYYPIHFGFDIINRPIIGLKINGSKTILFDDKNRIKIGNVT